MRRHSGEGYHPGWTPRIKNRFSNLMVDASGRRWLTHTDESEWIKVFDAEELDHRKLAFSGCRL
jgi:hypothetical protein